MHALLAGFVQDSLTETQNHCHKTDKIIARTLFFSKNQKTITCKTLAKNIDFICARLPAKKDNFYRLTKPLAEKNVNFTFTKTFAKKRQADFENLQSQTRIKPKPRNEANQNLCWPKPKLKTLKRISATGQNQPEIMPTKKTPPNKNAENLKGVCWKNID